MHNMIFFTLALIVTLFLDIPSWFEALERETMMKRFKFSNKSCCGLKTLINLKYQK